MAQEHATLVSQYTVATHERRTLIGAEARKIAALLNGICLAIGARKLREVGGPPPGILALSSRPMPGSNGSGAERDGVAILRARLLCSRGGGSSAFQCLLDSRQDVRRCL
jgi:hypothetical protein